jgi:hypothetical protein
MPRSTPSWAGELARAFGLSPLRPPATLVAEVMDEAAVLAERVRGLRGEREGMKRWRREGTPRRPRRVAALARAEETVERIRRGPSCGGDRGTQVLDSPRAARAGPRAGDVGRGHRVLLRAAGRADRLARANARGNGSPRPARPGRARRSVEESPSNRLGRPSVPVIPAARRGSGSEGQRPASEQVPERSAVELAGLFEASAGDRTSGGAIRRDAPGESR